MTDIAIDLCDPKRIEKIYYRFGRKFLQRILIEQEIADLESLAKKKTNTFHRLAGRYAAKEAVAKLLGTGIGEQLSFQDMAIIRDQKSGKPKVELFGKAKELAKKLKINEIKVSISHEKSMAAAVVLANYS